MNAIKTENGKRSIRKTWRTIDNAEEKVVQNERRKVYILVFGTSLILRKVIF